MSTAKASIVIGGTTKELEAAVDRAIGKLTGLAATAAGIFAGAATLSWGYDLMKQADSAEIAFTKMLGSASAAKQTLKEIADFASKTPMDNPTLVKAYQSLLAFKFGAEDIPGILRVIGDTASAMPGEMAENVQKLSVIMGQMRSKAKLSAGEMLQLTEAGVNAWEYLRQGMNLGSVADVVALSEKGAIDSATAVRMVLQGMEKDFSGLMETRSKTIEGLVSTIQDNLGRGLTAVFKGATGGEFKTWVEDFGNSLNGMGESGEAVGQRIAQSLQVVKNAFDGIHAVGSATYDVLSQAFSSVGITDFGAQVGQLRTDFAAVKAVALDFMQAVATGFAYVGDAVSMYFISPIRAIVGVVQRALADILGGFAYLADKLGTFSDTMADVAVKLRGISADMHQLGFKNIKGAADDMSRGFTSPDAVGKFFDNVRNKPAASSASNFGASAGMAAGLAAANFGLLDFSRKITDMTSLAHDAVDAFTKSLKEAAAEQAKRSDKLMEDFKSPGEKFQESLAQLTQMLESGQIHKGAFDQAVAGEFRNMAAGSLPQYQPNSAIMAGSAEAQATINAARFGGSNRLEDIMKRVEDETKASRRANEKTVQQLERAKVIPVGL